MPHQHQYDDPTTTTAQQQQKVQMKKTGKRSKSRGKRSKSRKSKAINNIDRSTIKQSNDYGDDQQEKVSVVDQQHKVKRSVLTSTTLSTKKQLSQQHQRQLTLSNQPHYNHNNNNKSSSERQVKLNYFLKKGQLNINNINSNNNNNKNSVTILNHGTTTTSITSKYAITQFQRKQSSLEKLLIQKQSILERMKLDRQIHTQRFNKLKIQSQQYKQRCRQTMLKQLRQYGRIRRQQKSQINPKYGYYRQAGWTTFIEGESLLNSKKKLTQLTQKIEELQTKRRKCTIDQRSLVIAQIDHLNKLLIQHKQQTKKLQSHVNQYKQRLRLADKQQSCTIAKHNWEVIQNRYLPIQLLGSGGFGEVYKAYDLDLNIHVAIKVNCFQPTKSPQYKEEFLKHVHRQVATLKQLNHPNIVKLIDEIIIDNKISFVLQYCTGPQLSKYLAKNQFLTEHQARAIIKQVSFALRYMFNQRNRIIHYDLKPANIMFHYGCVKILDFGLCKQMETQDTKIDLTSQGTGTYWYLPPQTFMDGAEISPKVDVWSMGVIFFQLLYGKRPFGHGIRQDKIYQDGIILKAMKVDFPTDKKYKVSQQAKNFIRECLRYDPDERLDPQQVYHHEYLKN